VRDLKEKIREADAVLIATPEYDYAIPGVLTTALDWALRSPSPLRHKPVGIVSG
jgi:chromate reductase, NAD(P)H dehydrogenase (quinone)